MAIGDSGAIAPAADDLQAVSIVGADEQMRERND